MYLSLLNLYHSSFGILNYILYCQHSSYIFELSSICLALVLFIIHSQSELHVYSSTPLGVYVLLIYPGPQSPTNSSWVVN